MANVTPFPAGAGRRAAGGDPPRSPAPGRRQGDPSALPRLTRMLETARADLEVAHFRMLLSQARVRQAVLAGLDGSTWAAASTLTAANAEREARELRWRIRLLRHELRQERRRLLLARLRRLLPWGRRHA